MHLNEFGATIPRRKDMSTTTQVASHLLRSRVGKICIAVTGSTPEEMLDRATEALKETSFIELRLDYLSKPANAIPLLKEFLAAHGGVSAIATCRCEENGGRFQGTSKAAVEILQKAGEAGFQLLDIELESVEKLPKGVLDQLRSTGAAVIVSFHDFKATKELEKVYERIEPFHPDFIKIVSTARSLGDNLTMMRFLAKMEDRSNGSIVGICMGEPGVISRILGLRAGSAFTFAAANTGEETAPGQITARALIETFRVEHVDKATKVYGVAGDPIRSSLSPLMLNTAFRSQTVNSVYLALQTSKAEDLLKIASDIPIQGMSVTMPLKEAVMPLLERSDPLSTKIGAVNTILRGQDGKFYGFNTDVAGITGPLERRLSLKGAKVLVLGAGGAARAAVFGCRDKGADVWILNRTPESAQKLAKQAGAKTIKRELVAKTQFDIVINATPLGMNGYKGTPLIDIAELNARLVFDLVYNPLETPLLRAARAKGMAVISGVEMFIAQGVRQFEIWTGKPAPEDDMLRVVLHALRRAAEKAGEAAPEMLPSPRLAPPAAAQPADVAPAGHAPVAQTSKAVQSSPRPKQSHGAEGKNEPLSAIKDTNKASTRADLPSAPAKSASATKPAAKKATLIPAKTKGKSKKG